MIRSAFLQIFIFHLRLRQQQLMPRGQRQIVRHMQIFEHLLRNAFEYRSSNLAALVRSHCRIENHRDHNLRIVHRRESGKRSDVFGLRICPRGRIHFLPRSRFSRRRNPSRIALRPVP